ncbi:hypothetical protein M0805_006407 [Coniferiporia weirii]|nr:hypothetical protein M0805_006407 [Coniferiporia weirii]
MAEQDWHLLSSYAGLLSLASFSIYAGSYASLKAPRKPKDTARTADSEDDDEEDLPERISAADAYLFPIIGSALLFGLYIVVKFLGVAWINWFLAWYFTIAGVGSVWKCSVSVSKAVLGVERWRSFSKFKLLVSKGPSEILNFSLRTPSLVLLIPSVVPSFLYTYLPGSKKSALLTDILALSFSHNALSIMKLDTFKTGLILLSGLFLYDIWWVFGTEVMVKVATSLDAPIKILWPKSYLFSVEQGFTMLGLGDIVVPGMFVSTALRYDLSKSMHRDPKRNFAKPYFTAAMLAYGLGLATTMTVMHTFGAAQPALLYLSPACILSFLLTALARGEFKEAWEWTDEAEHEDGEDANKPSGESDGTKTSARESDLADTSGAVGKTSDVGGVKENDVDVKKAGGGVDKRQ